MPDRRLRILQVVPVLSKGGAERIIVHLLNASKADGHYTELLVFCRSDHEAGLIESLDPSIPLRSLLGSFRPPILGWSGRLVRALQYPLLPILILSRFRYIFSFDVIDVHLPLASWFGTVVWRLRKLTGRRAPVVIETFHADFAWTSPARRRYFWKQWRHRDGLILEATTPPTVADVEAAYPHVHAVYIALGASRPAVETVTPAERSSHLAALNIPADCKYIVGTVSRLSPEREPGLYLPVFSEIAKRLGPDVHFLWAGDGPMRAAFEVEAKQRGLEHNLHFAGFERDVRVPLSVMCLYITGANGAVCGMAGMEAMLAGIPVVGVQHQPSADPGDWIFSSSDPVKLAQEVVSLLEDEPRRLSYRAMQSAKMEAEHTVEAMWRQTERFYLTLTSA